MLIKQQSQMIIQDMKIQQGIREEVIGNLKNISEIGNRKLAIKKAISELKRGDLLLIAGKGHEKFQSIMGKKFPFDDVKIAEKYLQKK